jgi:hypothetical protein
MASCPKFAWKLHENNCIDGGNVMDGNQVLKESKEAQDNILLLEAALEHKKRMYLACYFILGIIIEGEKKAFRPFQPLPRTQ